VSTVVIQTPWCFQPENHDTVGMLALDDHGNLSGASNTSGAATGMGTIKISK